MIIWNIAYKNIKVMCKNIFLIIFLTIAPLFMIYLFKMLSDNVEAVQNGGAVKGFVEIVILSQAKNSLLVQSVASGILVQFLLIAGAIAASMIVSERENNTLMRIFASPIDRVKILLGTLVGHSIIVITIAAFVIGASHYLFGVSWGDSWLNVFIVTLFAAYVTASFALLVSGIFKNSKITGGVLSVIIIIMTFMSGGLIQSEKLDTVSKFTINKWIAEAYSKLMEGQALSSLLQNFIIMGIMGTVFLLIANMFFRKENIYE